MIEKKDHYNEASFFFGAERMAQLESAIREQSQKSKSSIFMKKVFRLFKITSFMVLVIYAILTTTFILNNNIEQKGKESVVSNFTTSVSTPINPKNDMITIKKNSNTVANANMPAGDLLLKIVVKKGDSLSCIAQRIIKSNGFKNTYENREIVMGELKSKNLNLQENQLIRCGWTLLSLSQNEIKQICNN